MSYVFLFNFDEEGEDDDEDGGEEESGEEEVGDEEIDAEEKWWKEDGDASILLPKLLLSPVDVVDVVPMAVSNEVNEAYELEGEEWLLPDIL